MLQFTHFIFGALGVAALLASAVFEGAAWQLFDPDRDIASRLTTYLFPPRRDVTTSSVAGGCITSSSSYAERSRSPLGSFLA